MKDVYMEAEAAGLKVNDAPVRRLGFIILFAVFGIGGGWAALAPLNSAAFATGVVAVDSYRKSVQHLEGGIVREVRVHDGDDVKAGDVLIVLDSTQAGSELEAIRGQLIAAQAQEALKQKPDFSVRKDYLPTLHYQRESDLAHHRDALLKAGLPA